VTRRRHIVLLAAATLLALADKVNSSPFQSPQRRATAINPVISTNFADPSILQDSDGTWYAFATNNNPGPNVPAASAPAPSGPWSVLSNDLMPSPGAWSTGQNVWAPDVRKIGNTYVLYYTATDAAQTAQHCVGAATADTILGPYIAQSSPLACPLSSGGAIDPVGLLTGWNDRRNHDSMPVI
jgi:beta-xylosidase